MAWGSLQSVVAQFAPIAVLDKQEANYPSSTNVYVQQVGYQVAGGTSYAPTQWQWSTVPLGPNDNLVVPSTVPSTFQEGDLVCATVYVHAQAVKGESDTVDLQYWQFYNFNGSETLRAQLVDSAEMVVPLSYHWGDWECVIVRVAQLNNELQVVAVGFSQHGGMQWCLPVPDEMSFLSGTQRPLVYVSRGSHANRPAPGGPFWIGGLNISGVQYGMVDYANGDGYSLDYSKCFLIVANDAQQYFPNDTPPDPGWLKFQGKWGQDLRTTLSAEQAIQMVQTAAKSLGPMGDTLDIALAVPKIATSVYLMLFGVNQDAPRNPSAQGMWLNSLPLTPPLSSYFAPSLAALSPPDQENSLCVALVGGNVGGGIVSFTTQLITCSTEDGADWTATSPMHQASLAGPCLVPFNGGLCVAFTSSDSDHNLYTCLSADGVTWSKNYSTGQKSPTTPALAEFNGQLWLAFMANDNSKQNRLLKCSSTDGQKWTTDLQVPGQFTKAGPALASFNKQLWVAFIASDDSNQILICSSADGQTWTDNTPVPGAAATSTYTPALTVLNNNQLWLAFTNPAGNVMVCSSPNGQGWTAPTQVHGETSKAAPSLTTFNETLWVAFLANNSSNQVLLCSSPDGQNWSDTSLIYPAASS